MPQIGTIVHVPTCPVYVLVQEAGQRRTASDGGNKRGHCSS